MQVIEVVNIDDVYPVEDEYGNQYLSRDYSSRENRAYVDALARSMAKKGVPDELVTLVRDGGIYRVKAGNSRVMAMRQLGTKRFPAIIDEDDTPQALIEAAIRTDEKKAYEPVEKSRMVQQLALIASDEYVSEATGIEREQVAKVRRARMIVDDAAEDMSLLRLIAIADMEGDDEAVAALTTCSERDFPAVERNVRDQHARRERLAALCATLEARGVPLAESTDGLRYVGVCRAASDVPDDIPEGCVAVPESWGDGMRLYAPEAEREVDPAEEERRASAEALRFYRGGALGAREKWLDAHIGDDLSPLAELCDDSPYAYGVESYAARHGLELPRGAAHAIKAHIDLGRSPLGWDGLPDERGLEGFKRVGEAMAACGYEPCDHELQFLELCGGGRDE